jgi:hypothetical protein
MHAYALDPPEERLRVYGGLAVVAVAATILLEWLKDTTGFGIPWFVESPSVLGFYGLSYWLYKTFAWQWKLPGVRLSGLPDLSGTWSGEILSSHDGRQVARPATLRIRQDWSGITVHVETVHSGSHSTMAAFCLSEAKGPRLNYEFFNEPRVAAVDGMAAHRGCAYLRLSPDGKQLEGDYYTGRGRGTVGSMSFRRDEEGSRSTGAQRDSPEGERHTPPQPGTTAGAASLPDPGGPASPFGSLPRVGVPCGVAEGMARRLDG